MLRYVLLGSGSNGNCCIIESNNTVIAIDFGLTMKEIKERADKVGYDLDEIKALFITHNHTDHIRSIKYFPIEKVYATASTLMDLNPNIIEPFKTVYVGDLKITPIPTSHDALNSVGYIVESGNEKLVYMTDTGYVHHKFLSYLKDADHYVFESNHDETLLLRCKYPYFLKKRILSDCGHLSNVDCAEILSVLVTDKTKSIVLAHLSEEANTKEVAIKTLKDIFEKNGVEYKNIEIQAADRYKVTIGCGLNAIK
jgi:phosphoribosyl 1,2-cyclic phosphodiesterase